jgi:hypothetical protein
MIWIKLNTQCRHYQLEHPDGLYLLEFTCIQCLLRERFATQLCLQIWSGGTPVVSFPLSDVILAQLACPLSDVMFYLH